MYYVLCFLVMNKHYLHECERINDGTKNLGMLHCTLFYLRPLSADTIA